MYKLFIKSALLFLLMLSGCALNTVIPSPTKSTNESVALPDKTSLTRESLILARKGTDALQKNHYADASALFNQALRFEPKNAYLHFLNGLAYHLSWRAGEALSAELSETGYLLALQIDPTLGVAATQLGTLYSEQERHAAATGMLTRAITLTPQNAKIFYTLAYSAYYSQDVGISAHAAQRAVTLEPNNKNYLRAAVMTSSAIGDFTDAKRYLTNLNALDLNSASSAKTRLDQWSSVHNTLALNKLDNKIAWDWGAAPSANPAAPSTSPSAPSTTPAVPQSIATEGPLERRWSDCEQQKPNMGGGIMPGGGMGMNGIDVTDISIPALPSPCLGLKLPRMVMVDITILRSEVELDESHGVNLLNGLQVVLNGSSGITSTRGGANPARTLVGSSTIALPAAGITYALNLANSARHTSTVLAKPTLLALDREPSNFFSGANLSVSIAGTQSGGSLIDKMIGVALSVTPTFIDDDTMLLAVKASRSFVDDQVATGSFDKVIATTRNSVTANAMLKFDQTLVLSGMREHDKDVSRSGVPLLKDIPGIQYFFNKDISYQYTNEVVIVMTPRRPQHLADALTLNTQYSKKNELDERGNFSLKNAQQEANDALSPSSPNLKSILTLLASHNDMFTEFRNGDISKREISNNFDLNQILQEVWHSLLF